jgi:hypothetical protein
VVVIVVMGGTYLPGIALSSDATDPSASVEGEILAIKTVSEGNQPSRKEALVKLASEKQVRAYVPPACVVFPGQIARLSRFDVAGGIHSSYVLKGSREKE